MSILSEEADKTEKWRLGSRTDVEMESRSRMEEWRARWRNGEQDGEMESRMEELRAGWRNGEHDGEMESTMEELSAR